MVKRSEQHHHHQHQVHRPRRLPLHPQLRMMISPSLPTANLTLPVPPKTINFFSTSTDESKQLSSNNLRTSTKTNIPPFHHNQHHPKIKKSINRQLSKFDRRLETKFT